MRGRKQKRVRDWDENWEKNWKPKRKQKRLRDWEQEQERERQNGLGGLVSVGELVAPLLELPFRAGSEQHRTSVYADTPDVAVSVGVRGQWPMLLLLLLERRGPQTRTRIRIWTRRSMLLLLLLPAQ